MQRAAARQRVEFAIRQAPLQAAEPGVFPAAPHLQIRAAASQAGFGHPVLAKPAVRVDLRGRHIQLAGPVRRPQVAPRIKGKADPVAVFARQLRRPCHLHPALRVCAHGQSHLVQLHGFLLMFKVAPLDGGVFNGYPLLLKQPFGKLVVAVRAPLRVGDANAPYAQGPVQLSLHRGAKP